jgi:hypothetical protein
MNQNRNNPNTEFIDIEKQVHRESEGMKIQKKIIFKSKN